MVKLVATLSSYGRRVVVVGGVADRYAGELARAGQSNRRRAGTGSASPQRATRPPLWPAGMAEGNRATFGPRVGLSSHGSPAKGGPKSKCLARVKIARTSAQFRTRPAFANPVPLSPIRPAFANQYRTRTCPAFPIRTRPAFPILSHFPNTNAYSAYTLLSCPQSDHDLRGDSATGYQQSCSKLAESESIILTAHTGSPARCDRVRQWSSWSAMVWSC